MTEIPHISEAELFARLEVWLAAHEGEPPNIFQLIEQGELHILAALILKGFRSAAREAVVRRLDQEALGARLDPDDQANSVMRVFAGLAEAWRLSTAEQIALLGIGSEAEIEKLEKAATTELPVDVIERVATLLDIFKAINTLLPVPERADAWLRAPNSALLFGGRSALDVMTRGVDQMRRVRQYLLAEIWGG